jgi:FixJ family two-component response regulator
MALLLAVTQRDRRTRRSAIGNRPYLPTLVLEGADMEKWPVIAIVDDDKWIRKSLERLLKSAGYRSEAFISAEHYLAARNQEEIGCLILDIGLPGMNGFELERFLAAEHNRLPIVFVSAHDEPEVRDEAAHAGAVAFLGKPFDDNALLDAIGTALK